MTAKTIVKLCFILCALLLFLDLLMGAVLWHRGFSPALLPVKEWAFGRLPPRFLINGGNVCRWKLGFYEMTPNCMVTPCYMCSPFS